MKTGNEKIVHINRKGFNILEVDDQLLKDLFNRLVRECGNYCWRPTKEEIEELCCETYKRRLYELNTIYSHRTNLMNEWTNWDRAFKYANSACYGKIVFEPYVGRIHTIIPDTANDGHSQITIDPNILTYSNNNFYTYFNEDLDRLAQNHAENVWEREIHREPRHADFQSMINRDGDIIHRYMPHVENMIFGATIAVDVYINTGNVNIEYGRVDRFYGILQNYIYEYVQTCGLDELIRINWVIWENGTMFIKNTYGEVVFALNDINMEV